MHTFIIHQFFFIFCFWLRYCFDRRKYSVRTAFRHSKNRGTTGSKTLRRRNFLAETPSVYTSPVYIKNMEAWHHVILNICIFLCILNIYLYQPVYVYTFSKYLSNPVIKKDYSFPTNYHHNDFMTELSADVTDAAPGNSAGLTCITPADHS